MNKHSNQPLVIQSGKVLETQSLVVLIVSRVLPLQPLKLLCAPGVEEVGAREGWKGKGTLTRARHGAAWATGSVSEPAKSRHDTSLQNPAAPLRLPQPLRTPGLLAAPPPTHGVQL